MNRPEAIRYRLSPSVFYRVYDDNTVVYDTQAQKVYTFNESAGDIFACFKEYTTVEDAVRQLLQIYEIEEEESFADDIRQFVQEVESKGLIKKEYRQIGVLDDLEKEISASFEAGSQLYTATMELTYRCNEKCRHCYIANDSSGELSTEKIKSIIDELYEMNTQNLVFTGGEVFIRPDAFEILEYAYEKRFVVDIFTNGNLIDGNDYIRLKRTYPRCVHFSVYSHVPEKHDAVTRVKGSFEKTLHSIKSCVSIGIPVNIKTPVFSETMEDVPGIAALAKKLGCSIELSRNITPKKDGNQAPLAMKIQPAADNIAILDLIQDLIPTIDNLPGERPRRDKLCGAGDKSISIDPYGKVFPCNVMPLCIGDLREQSVRDIWEQSEKLAWWRENNKRALRKGCEACEHAEDCRFCPGEAMMWTEDPLSKYEEACLTTKYFLAQAQEGR